MAEQRILLADDDRRLILLVRTFLGAEGFEVDTATDGVSAVEQALGGGYALVILDIMMPGIDGLEACRRIRSHPVTADTPILIFSALREEGESARLAGADAMLKKPFSLPTLAETVRRLAALPGGGAAAAPGSQSA